MAERHLVVDNLKFAYEGLCNPVEIYNLVSTFFYERGWDWVEKMNQEEVASSGKQVKMILQPYLNRSDYYKQVINIKIHMINLNRVEIEHENQTLYLHRGVIRIVYNGYVVSDRKDKWVKKPFFWFISLIFERYFFRQHFAKFTSEVETEINNLSTKIKNYLNVFKYTYER